MLLVVRRAVVVALAALLLGWCSRLWLPRTPSDVRAELAFLDEALAAGAADEMQALFPEGHLFMWALAGLAWVEEGRTAAPGSAERALALARSAEALAQTDTDIARAPFDRGLSPPNGVFYFGWTTLLRAGVVELGGEEERPRLYADAAVLLDAFAAAGTPFLPSYDGMAWPADNVVAQAALARVAALGGPASEGARRRWLDAVRARVDPATGMVAHAADPRTGAPAGGTRGSSSALMLRFWPSVDPAFAEDQYTRFRATFLTRRVGLPAILEYPGGVGAGDIDSGPILWGVSLPGSAVAIGAARANGDLDLSDALRHTADLVGVQVNGRILAGAIPIGDAFLAFSTGATAPTPSGTPWSLWWWWRVPTSLGVAAALAVLVRIGR